MVIVEAEYIKDHNDDKKGTIFNIALNGAQEYVKFEIAKILTPKYNNEENNNTIIKVKVIRELYPTFDKVGDILEMSKTRALLFKRDGFVEIIEEPKKVEPKKVEPKKVEIIEEHKKVEHKKVEPKKVEPKKEIVFENPDDDGSTLVEQLVLRRTYNKKFLEIFTSDDLRKKTKIHSEYIPINKENISRFAKFTAKHNIDNFGVFVNINPLSQKKRHSNNISDICNIFIELEQATEDHNEIVKTNLKNMNITYSYNARSGDNYHFIIPVDMKGVNEYKVKGFINYMNAYVCNNVNVLTYNNEQLIRIQDSIKFKTDKQSIVKKIHSHISNKNEAQSNSVSVYKYQLEYRKGVKDRYYLESLKRYDSFFTSILNKTTEYKKIQTELNKYTKLKKSFVDNLAIYSIDDEMREKKARSFLTGLNGININFFKNQILTSKNNGYNTINYHNILEVSKKHKVDEITNKLNNQLQKSFLDEYEIYYLEAEKPECNHVIFFPEKNYYIQKSFQEILINISYLANDKGITMSRELHMEEYDDKWDEKSYKQKTNATFDHMKYIFDVENRIKTINNINYAPIDNKYVYNNGKKYFNTYTKTKYWDYNKTAKKYHFPHIKDLLMNLVGEEERHYDYFNKWIGWIIQNPTAKLPTAVIFQGKPGSGKGTFKSHILDSIFGENCQEINQTHLESTFNEYLMGKQIIVANEVMHNENRQTLPNVLKNLVTDPDITISRKFRKEIVCKNYTHWIFCTNSDNPLKIEEDDRRYNVFYSEKLKGGGKAAAEFVQELQINLDYELKEYISYLKSLEIYYHEVHTPIHTDAKDEIVELNKNSIDKFNDFIGQFKLFDEMVTSLTIVDNKYETFKPSSDDNYYISSDNFYVLYCDWCESYKERGVFSKQNFTKNISKYNCKSSPKWKTGSGAIRCYKIKDIETIMKTIADKNKR